MQTTVRSTDDLVTSIKSRIHTRTHGRVFNLHVELSGGGVVLRGRASTYYTKQLALHGAREVLSSQPIVNAIDVRK